MKQTRAFTREQLCRLLAFARRATDPRVAAALTLILGYSLSVRQLLDLFWHDLDTRHWTLTIRKCPNETSLIDVSSLLGRQLLSIKSTGPKPRIFAPPSPEAPTIGQAMNGLLQNASLGQFSPNDLVQWSRQQSQAVRMSLAN